MTTYYRGSIVGDIWMPYGHVPYRAYALDVPRFDAEDDEDAIDMIATRLSGDFASVLDVEVWRIDHSYSASDGTRIDHTQETSTLIKRFSEEAEIAYCDAPGGCAGCDGKEG